MSYVKDRWHHSHRGFQLDSHVKLWLPLYKYGAQDLLYDHSGNNCAATPLGATVTPYPHSASGAELVSNGAFETDPNTEWTETDCTIASVAGGYSGNCMQITRTGGVCQYFEQTIPIVAGRTYRMRVWVKSGTSGNEAFRFHYGPDAGSLVSGTTSAVWTAYETVWVAGTTNQLLSIYKDTATAGTMLFDEVSIQEMSGWESRGFTFDGINDLIPVTYNACFDLTDLMSIMMWVRVAKRTVSSQMIFWRSQDLDLTGYAMGYGTTTANHFSYWNDGIGVWSESTSTLGYDRWYQIGMTGDQGGIGWFYLNGIRDGAIGYALPAANIDANLILGSTDTPLYPFGGQIGDVVLWDRPLTQQEVQGYYEITRGIFRS